MFDVLFVDTIFAIILVRAERFHCLVKTLFYNKELRNALIPGFRVVSISQIFIKY
jgi:hypothetical protein